MSDFIENAEGVHLMGITEFTLCGDAFDIGETESDATPLKPTQKRTVTCLRCAQIINLCRGVRVGTPPEQGGE